MAGDLAGAVQLYQASLAELPTAEAHTFLGWVYSFDRRYDEAIAECKRAMDAPRYEAPQFPHVNLARIYEKKGQVLDAVAEYGHALDKQPGYGPALAGLRRLQTKVN